MLELEAHWSHSNKNVAELGRSEPVAACRRAWSLQPVRSAPASKEELLSLGRQREILKAAEGSDFRLALTLRSATL